MVYRYSYKFVQYFGGVWLGWRSFSLVHIRENQFSSGRNSSPNIGIWRCWCKARMLCPPVGRVPAVQAPAICLVAPCPDRKACYSLESLSLETESSSNVARRPAPALSRDASRAPVCRSVVQRHSPTRASNRRAVHRAYKSSIVHRKRRQAPPYEW